MRTLFSILLSTGAVAVLTVLAVHGREMRAAFGTANRAVVGLFLVVGSNVAALLMPDRTATALGVIAAAFLALVLVGARRRDVVGGADPARRAAWYVTGLLIGWCFVVDVNLGHGVYQDRYLTYGASAVVWLATGLFAGQVTTALAAWAYAGGGLMSLLTLTTVVDTSLWAGCMHGDFEKCSPAGALFRSFASSENYVAILAGFTIVAAVAALHGRARLVIAVHSGVAMVATGSRTGMLAVGVALLVVLTGRVVESRGAVVRLPRQVCVVVALVLCGTGVDLVLTSAPDTLSRRGAIWVAVRRHLDGDLATGVGISKWGYYQGIGQSPQHFFHSTYALVLFAGGFVGIAIFTCWSYVVLRRTANDGRAVTAAAPAVLLLVYAFTEVVWNPVAFDGLSWMVVALLCTGSCGGTATLRSDEVVDRAASVTVTGTGR